jgi:dTDP-4-amino-4,6-dideoxygalactose transaminase
MTMPVSEETCNNIVAIPVHHGLSSEDMEYIISAIRAAVKK